MEPVEVIIKKEKKPWYKNSLVVIPLLLFFPYIGIPWVWKFTDYSGPLKVILTGMELLAIIYFSAQYNTLWFIIILIVSSVILNKFVDSEFKWKGGDNMKKKIILGVIGVIILFAIISAIGGSGNKGSSTQTTTTTSTNTTKPAPAMAKIGEAVTDKDLSFTVSEIKTASSVGNSYTKKEAQGIFTIVTVKIANNTKETKTIDSSAFQIVDSQGRKFDRSIEGQTAKGMSQGQVDLFLQQVQPSLSVTGDVVFDIPKDATGLKLLVKGSVFSSGTEIDLGK